MADNKVYIGYTNVKQTKFGEIISISLNEEHRKLLEQYVNDAGYVNIDILESRKGGKYSIINTWNTGKLQENGSIVATKVEPKVNEEPDEIILDEIPW